jgi:hypothetical protein
MNIGERYSLKYKHPHRLEAVVVELTEDAIICEVDHRCPATCYLQAERNTLPLHGRRSFLYHEFAELFVAMAREAIALPGQRSA